MLGTLYNTGLIQRLPLVLIPCFFVPLLFIDLLTAVLNGYESLNEPLFQWPYSSIVHAPGARITVQGNLLCGYRPRHVYTAKKQIRHGGSWRIFDALESDYRYQFAVTCRCASGTATSSSPLPLKHESLSLAESETLQHRLCRLPELESYRPSLLNAVCVVVLSCAEFSR